MTKRALSALLFASTALAVGIPAAVSAAPSTTAAAEKDVSFKAFTGRLTRNKVRLRLQPNLDCGVVKELDRGELIAIVGETDDFFVAAADPTDHAYVYSTYVVDGVIDGNRVNVRLRPELDAPVLTQMNTGDRASGNPCPVNSKWIEMSVPESVSFYVAKEFIEPVGDAQYLTRMRERESEAQQLIDSAYMICESELQKPFDVVNIDSAQSTFVRVIRDYDDFPDLVEVAQEKMRRVAQAYTQKKLAYLESKVKRGSSDRRSKHAGRQSRNIQHPLSAASNEPGAEQTGQTIDVVGDLDNELESYHARLDRLEERLQGDSSGEIAAAPKAASAKEPKFLAPDHTRKPALALFDSRDVKGAATGNSGDWEPVERHLFASWAMDKEAASLDDFYTSQQEEGVKLTGKVKPYGRPVKNKPGDFMLIDPNSERPVAYLYSTQVDLEDAVGKEVTIIASPRDNHHFAHPAYHALSVE